MCLSGLLACSSPSGGPDDDDGADDDDGTGGDWDSSDLDPAGMAVYLGSPSAVTAADFAGLAIVVLGENPDASYAEHDAWVALAGDVAAQGAQVYGWLEAGAPRAGLEIDTAIADYGAAGLYGVTLSGLGMDVVGNNEARPIFFANNARSSGLSVMMTAPTPSDVLGELDGVGQAVHPGDRFLLQGFTRDGGWQAEAIWRSLVDEARAGASAYGATVVATTSDDWDEAAWSFAYHAAWLDGLEAVGWGMPDFGAVHALPFPGPLDGGSAWTSEVTSDGSTYSRTTDTGTLRVDAGAHTASFE